MASSRCLNKINFRTDLKTLVFQFVKADEHHV